MDVEQIVAEIERRVADGERCDLGDWIAAEGLSALRAALSSAAGAGQPRWRWIGGDTGECSKCGKRLLVSDEMHPCAHFDEHETSCWRPASPAPEDAAKLEDATAQVEALRALGVPAQVNPDYPFAPAPPAAARGYERKTTDIERRFVEARTDLFMERFAGQGLDEQRNLPALIVADLRAAERALSSSEAESEERNEEILNLRAACMDETAGVLQRDEEIRDLRGKLAAAEARAEAMREAVTPSGSTKAAYLGEFKEDVEERDEEGDFHNRSITVSWTTIKDIMAAITKRAAASARGKEAGRG